MSKKKKFKPHNIYPDYVVCLSTHHDPEDNSFVRVTAALTDIRTNNTKSLELLDFWVDDDFDDEEVNEKIADFAKGYNAEVIVMPESFPLQKCPCENCEEYVYPTISREFYIELQKLRK
jgi:hypothetical protein